jgi:hypothetical protein
MPVFDTPEPISATLHLQVSDTRIIAGARGETEVTVRPANPGNDADVRAAEQTRIEFSNGTLLVEMAKRRSLFGDPGSVEVTVELPGESGVHGVAAMGEFRCEGRLGECTLTTSAGDIHVDRTAAQRLSTAYGDITVHHATGDADISTGSGSLRVQTIDGTAVIKNSNGPTRIGEVTGDLRVNSANGDITVDVAHAAVNARTANGSVRIGEVTRGAVVVETAAGELQVGIGEGTAAWLDLSSVYGAVVSSLEAADGPGESRATVEVRARTGFGDVLVHRS